MTPLDTKFLRDEELSVTQTQLPKATSWLQEGTMLKGGTYRVLSHLGQGGFGMTYVAEHVAMSRRVCIKEFFITSYCRRDASNRVVTLTSEFEPIVESLKQKFVKEAVVLATLDHPNIVRVHDSFTENNSAYYVMEYIDGDTLENILHKDGVLNNTTALNYIREVASALDYIHKRNLLHLDIKPSNIMVRNADKRVILIDFGLTKHYDEVNGKQTTPSISGASDGYTPIEQYQHGVVNFTPGTDIYSLGATLYTMLTADIPPLPNAIDSATFPSHPKVKFLPEVRRAINRAMRYNCADRQRSIREFVGMLDGHHPRRRLWPIIIGVVGLLSVAIAVVAVLLLQQPAEQSNDAEPVIVEPESVEDICAEAESMLGDGEKQRAFELWHRAAEMGSEEAILAVADCYSKGIGVDVDLNKAIEWYEKAAKLGNTQAMFNIGVCYTKRGEPHDIDRAIEWIRESAELDNVTAQYQLGVMAYQGKYMERNESEAVQWFTRAAKKGHVMSESALASYYSSKGDMVNAVKWFTRAAEHGVAEAQYNLGVCYFNGLGGLSEDRALALNWYKKAADQGHVPAKQAVAECEKYGWGTSR